MNEQVGWRGLLLHLKKEAPRYVQLLPELPRLLHDALRTPRGTEPRLLEAVLAEQRRTNRLLRAIIYGAIGFLLGLVATQVMTHWR
jgi:ubiquinone biosynthesis protein